MTNYLRANQISIPIELLTHPGEYDWQTEANDLKTLTRFYFQATAADAAPLNEAKLLIIGEGSVGKTTLAQKLQNPNYELKLEDSDNPEKSTEGIEVNRISFEQPNGTPFKINLWDFGGQDIYHATHQFFLTRRSLYALVIDSRRDLNLASLYYWLNVVRLLGDSSPVLLIKNEKQKRQCEIDEGSLRKEFPNLINQSISVDFADNSGLEALKTFIQHHITQLDEVNKPWPHNWAKIRYALENYSKNPNAHYITQTEYLDLCRREGIPDKSEALTISRQLHELGICLHFQTDPGLKHYIILRPLWATNAVYKVTDTQAIKDDLGRFSRDDLRDIWKASEYAEVQDELLALMQKFAICYPLRDRPNCFIAPSLLGIDRPDYDWDTTDNLILRYDYDFMPKGILTRLIVEMHELIEPCPHPPSPGLVWKTGVILRHGNARAEVIENYTKSEITLRVSGTQQKTLLDWIRREIYKIHSSYPRIQVEELIPCNCNQCDGSQTPHLYKFNDLERRLANKRHEVECEISYQMVNVQRLIFNITDTSRLERENGVEAAFRGNQLIFNLPNQTYQEASSMTQETSQTTNNFNGPMSGVIASQFSDNAQASSNTFSQTNQTEPLPPLAAHEQPLASAKTILFLASNPKQTGRLRLDLELREIDESLRRAQRRNQFNLENKGAIRLRDFTRAVLDHTPQILHFSGHGIAIPSSNNSPEFEGLLFEDDQGNPKLIPSEQLAALFDLFSDTVECVILNACYSKIQAEAIAQHIPYVIGMERAIRDRSAIEFAIAFYDTLGAGKDIEFAYKLARIPLMESNEQDIPKLIHVH